MAFYVTDKDGKERLIAGAGRVGPRGLPGPPGPKGDTGDDGNPIGTVISFLGLTAPEGYLVCDGAAYSIADYPALSAFIAAQFGSANHFGGDGTTTFAVPDMRNLFLRGYHGTAEEQLSGDVGARQEGTRHANNYIDTLSDGNAAVAFNMANTVGGSNSAYNTDTTVLSSKFVYESKKYSSDENFHFSQYTSRPVNAAVLYCIKAVKTVSSAPPPTAADVSYDSASSGLEAETVQGALDEVADKLAAGEVYSTEEVRIGTWVDGKPLYRRAYHAESKLKANVSSFVSLDQDFHETLISAKGFATPTWSSRYALPYIELSESKIVHSYSIGQTFETNNYTLWVNCFSAYDTDLELYVIIEYTKTTDAAEGS